MADVPLVVNGEATTVDAPPDMPLLWALRDRLGLTGTKYGCGIAQCGTCTVHVDGEPVRSCVTPLAAVEGAEVTTIEGLSEDGLHPVQEAWIEEDVPQCGYCQAGQVMSAVALLESNPHPSEDDVDDAMRGNLCRCGTYGRVRRAIRRASGMEVDDA